MAKSNLTLRSIYAYLIASSTTAYGASITWEAQNPNNDLNVSTNWSPATVPGSSDEAIFDSSISGIDTNPTANVTPFSVSSFNFTHNASVFTFNFNNTSLVFNGAGITGIATNPIINITNANNSSFPGNLVSFLGVTGNAGSSIFSISNNAVFSGNHSSTSLGAINSNFISSGPFTILSNGQIIASNSGNDSTVGTGNNGVANTASSQIFFQDAFTAGSNVDVSVSNSGIFSGTNTSQGDAVSIVNGSQFISSGAFQVGDSFNCQVQNTGINSNSGIGLSNIGQINAAQMILQTTAVVGNNCTINISNAGLNSSQASTFSDNVGYLNDEQFFVGNSLQAGNDFSLTVSNSGTDSSSGHGASQVAVINSNSGTTGDQVLLSQGGVLRDRAAIHVTNSGIYSGTNNSGGSSVGLMNLSQLAIGDSGNPGSYNFSAGDDFSLTVSSSGVDSGHGTGGDVVGDVSTDQVVIYTPCSLGSNAQITITMSGIYSGHATGSYVNVGSAGGSQLHCASTFQASDNFNLIISNSGNQSGSGIGDNFIGDIIGGQQANFANGITLGNNAIINISNQGFNSSNTTAGNQVGSMMGYGKQFLAGGLFQVGNNLSLTISNSGFDDSIGHSGGYVGFINNNSADQTGSQLHLHSGGVVGDDARLTLTNTGTYQGSISSGNCVVGVLDGQQFCSASDFHAGNGFNMEASNVGVDNASGQNNQTVGCVGNSSQVEFQGACNLGSSASIVINNNGTNNDTTGTSNTIGIVGGGTIFSGWQLQRRKQFKY